MGDREGAIVLTMVMKDGEGEKRGRGGDKKVYKRDTMYIIIKLIERPRDSYC